MKIRKNFILFFIFLGANFCFSQIEIDIANDSILRKINKSLPEGWVMYIDHCSEACSLMVERKDSVYEVGQDSLKNCPGYKGKNLCDDNWIAPGGEKHKVVCWFVFTEKVGFDKIKVNISINDSLQKKIDKYQKQKKPRDTKDPAVQKKIFALNSELDDKIFKLKKQLIPILFHCSEKYHVLSEYFYAPVNKENLIFPRKANKEIESVYSMMKNYLELSCNYHLR